MNKEEQIKFIEENYPLYTHHTSNRSIRHDFFKNISTELQAYLLGFYTADGSIDEKRKTFRIHQSIKDSELVYLYKDIISPDARLFSVADNYKTTGRDGKEITGHGSIGVDISSAILVNDLVELGIGYKKTYSDLTIPNIPENLIRHFVRGFFDGDGSISTYLACEKGKKDRVRCGIQIDSKTKTLLENIQLFFKNNNIKFNLIYLKRDDMYRISTSSREEIKKLYLLFYKDSYFYLSRKFNKFGYYVNTEVSQLIADHRNA